MLIDVCIKFREYSLSVFFEVIERTRFVTDRQTDGQTDARGKTICLPTLKGGDIIMGLISNMWLFFVTQYNSSVSSFVSNFRILTQVVAEKSLTEKKKFTDRQTNTQTNI